MYNLLISLNKERGLKGYFKQIVYWILISWMVISASGCDRGQIQDLPPGEIVARSTTHMIGLKGFEYLIQRTGALVFFDYAETVAFSRAEGQFVSPDRVFARVRVVMPGLVTDVNIINIQGRQWETNLVSGEWQVSDPLYTFNPSLLFNSETGIQSILANELSNLVLVGLEEIQEIPGKELYVLEADLSGKNAHYLTYGMIDDEPLHVKIWVDPGSFDMLRIVVLDPVNPGDGEGTTWQIDFWNFDQMFSIQEPLIPTP